MLSPRSALFPFVLLPSLLLLGYLAVHVTEGWQLLVVAAFAAGFLLSWLKHSRLMLITSYSAATLLSAWVFFVNF